MFFPLLSYINLLPCWPFYVNQNISKVILIVLHDQNYGNHYLQDIDPRYIKEKAKQAK